MDKSYFNGKAFEDMGITVERIHDDLPAMRENVTERSGRHGSTVNSLTLGPREITLECRAFEDRWADYDSLMDTISAWLVTSSDKKLQLRNHPGQYYMAHYVSVTESERIGETGIGGFELAFTATDPVRFGEDRSYVLSGTDQAQITIGGTDSCDMRIEVRGATKDSSNTWAMKLAGTTMTVPLSAMGTHSITLDCANRAVKVDDKASCLTLGSNWPTLTPGKKTVQITVGSGTATLSWKQRYL